MSKVPHISEQDLIRFADGEVHGNAANFIQSHLEACAECQSHLQRLKSAAAAYAEYHEQVLKPSLNYSPEWKPLAFFDRKTDPSKNWFTLHAAAWWAAAAIAVCFLVFSFFFYHEAPNQRITQLLANAAAVPQPLHKRLQVTWNGQSWYRPAVLQSDAGFAGSGAGDLRLEHTRALFVRANYSWDNPLSARSFAAWRNQLPEKRDQVVSVRDGDGNSRFYRLRTETSQGVLRSASLTLQADTLHPVEGIFRFENREDVTMTDAGEMPATPSPEIATAPVPRRDVIETKVTPEDELRVFAALNAIGADADEPLTVGIDPAQQHIVISGVGISADREQEIRQALNRIPNIATHFDAGQPLQPGKPDFSPDNTYSTGTPAPLRHELESRAGGTQAFQDIADRALDESSSLLAQAHALYVLAQRFPPAVESNFGIDDRATLHTLRQRHAKAIDEAISQLRQTLLPLLASQPNNQTGSGETRNPPQSSWQSGAGPLLEQSKLLDQSLSQLLAGAYSQQRGEDILGRLPDEIRSVQQFAQTQEIAP